MYCSTAVLLSLVLATAGADDQHPVDVGGPALRRADRARALRRARRRGAAQRPGAGPRMDEWTTPRVITVCDRVRSFRIAVQSGLGALLVYLIYDGDGRRSRRTST